MRVPARYLPVSLRRRSSYVPGPHALRQTRLAWVALVLCAVASVMAASAALMLIGEAVPS